MKNEHDTGLLHDDDGNTDDRRVAGALMVITALGMAIADLWPVFVANERIVEGLLYAGALLLGSTVAEKFKR
jgi:hypothetical protein